MEDIKWNLLESGVIGRVLDDFNPRLLLILFYGHKRISLGDQVTLAEVQRQPTRLQQYAHFLDQELLEIFKQRKLVVLVMTDPEARGSEYLHWLTMQYICNCSSTAHEELPSLELVAYEPPRAGARRLVLTLFQANDHFKSVLTTFSNTNDFRRIAVHNSREKFSTRTFVHTNALGSPLGASFFNINYHNESDSNDDCVSSVGSNDVEIESTDE